MNTRDRNLLALALAAAMLSPAAWAGKGGKNADQVPPTSGSPVSDALRSEGPVNTTDQPAAGQTVSQAARDANAATRDDVTSNDASTQTSNDATTQVTTSNDATAQANPTNAAATDDDATQTARTRGVHERMVKNPTNTEQTDLENTSPVPPTKSQGAANAAAHASVTQRELWGRLDTDGDGQISAAESAVDGEFNAGFQAMDTNDDGLVTGDEYQVAARTDLGSGQAQGGVNAASHSTASVRDLIGRLDTNADGSISATEAQADASFNASFAAADANSDGMVSSQEYQAWQKAHRK